MDILNKIVVDKKREVEAKKGLLSKSFLQNSPLFSRDCFSMSKSLTGGSGIIAEFKRRSPSKQVINHSNSVIDVVKDYQDAGVSAISVLTDTKYFGGSLDDLVQARAHVKVPILRKDFMIDPYQLYEAKAFGADAILLIAAILKKNEIIDLARLARELKMEVLLEVHNRDELIGSDLDEVQLVGVNNRNLKTFEVSLDVSKQLANLIPAEKVKISESGLSSIAAIKDLKNHGYRGFLIGENFMKTDDPGKEASLFLKHL